MAVTGPPRAAGGRVGVARRGTLPRAAPLHRRVYSRYCKVGATLAGIGVRAGQDPFRGSAMNNHSSLADAHIALICIAARLHRLDPAAAHNEAVLALTTEKVTQRG